MAFLPKDEYPIRCEADARNALQDLVKSYADEPEDEKRDLLLRLLGFAIQSRPYYEQGWGR